MANNARPHIFLQENILAMLVHSNEQGKIIANLIAPELFEGDYRVIAEAAVEYWRTQGQAPKTHMPDLLGKILTDPNNKRAPTLARVLTQLFDLSKEVNSRYVMDSLRAFVRTQHMKSAILQSYEKIAANQEMAIGEVEELWQDLLRTREIAFDPGLRLDDYDRMLQHFEQHRAEFRTSVSHLNERFIVPSRTEVILFIASANKGKTWWLIDLGRQALNLRKKVLHISLEMSEEQVLQRYYQNMFSIAKREALVETTKLDVRKIDGKEGFYGFILKPVHPDFNFRSEYIRDELRVRVDKMGTRMRNLVIKRFPGRSLTTNGLNAYLDQLEIVDGFVPDLLALDYIGIMKTDPRNHRLDLGRNFEDFRGICVERNMAGATAHQASKEGEKALRVRSAHVAEDWSMIGTADNIITYSQTEAEKKYGLARLFVSKARTEDSGFNILITQSYPIGQFCLGSLLLTSKYEKMVADFVKDEVTEESDEPDDDKD